MWHDRSAQCGPINAPSFPEKSYIGGAERHDPGGRGGAQTGVTPVPIWVTRSGKYFRKITPPPHFSK